MADLNHVLRGGNVCPSDQETCISGAELMYDSADGFVLLGVECTRACVLPALARGDEAYEQPAGGVLFGRLEVGKDFVSALGHRTMNAARLAISIQREAIAFPRMPRLL